MTNLGLPLARRLLSERHEHASVPLRQRQASCERHGQDGETLGRTAQRVITTAHGGVHVHERRPLIGLHNLERGALFHDA